MRWGRNNNGVGVIVGGWLLLVLTVVLLERGGSVAGSTSILGDPYEILGVSRRASPVEIRKAYKSLAVTTHPDKNQDPEAQDQFVRINRAYEVNMG